MRNLSLVVLLIVSCFASGMVYAQEAEQMELKDSTYLKKKSHQQQYDYENYLNSFPPEKKNTWAIGIHGGIAYISGDVASKLGWGAGLNIEKALGHLISLRLQGLYAKTSGQDWTLTRIAGQPNFYRNYETDFTDVNLQAVFHINNINFHKKEPKVIFSIFGGLGFATSQTNIDRLDDNGIEYDYFGVPEATTGAWFPKEGEIGKGDVRDALDLLMDGEAETPFPRKSTVLNIKERTVHPSYVVGGGVHFRLGKRVDLNLEHRVSFHSDDLLDGTNEAVKNNFPVLSQGTDLLNYTSAGLSFKIGKREESLYWVNPLSTPYDDIRDLKKKMDAGEFFKDEDEDGVVDALDLEQNTPPKVAVNTKGVTLDSDNDGVPDYLDKQLFTPAGATIDANGVALDSDQDGVPDIFDKEASTPPGSLVDVNGMAIKLEPTSKKDEMGIVYFDYNSSTVKREFYPVLHGVASFMESNANAKVQVNGNTDIRGSENYNNKLGEKRANKVIDVLSTAFGIPKDRFVVVSNGARNNMVPNLPKSFNSKYEGGHYLNRRVDFKVIR